ncbi:MAG TPA: family 1 encapsulin nanocompartment shell protein [Gammaproteobacteria bacterium]
MDHLLRGLAPIGDNAWREIDAEAARTLRRTLAGRKLVDFTGPLGWDVSAVGRGRVRDVLDRNGVKARLRETQPLVEIDVPFRLARAEIDAIERGAKDADLNPVVHAARLAALTEDRAIFAGLREAGIAGIFERCREQTLPLSDDYERYPRVVAAALTRLRNDGIEGPYAIALGPRCYEGLTETTNKGGYPVINMVRQQLDDRIIWAPAVDGAVVLSLRGGDFELTVGQDFAIGYAAHDAQHVELFVRESMTFAVYTPEAAVPLEYESAAARSTSTM